MPDWNQVDRSHVMAAMAEYDSLGHREFLRRYGLRRSVACTLWHRGQEYDGPAVLGAAYLHATGAPVASAVGHDGAARVLGELGFDVVVDEEQAPAPRTRRTPAAAKPRKSSTAPALKVCPTCHMALPASGVCDFCD
jgi:hypothetical protein